MKDYNLSGRMPDYAISRHEILELVRESNPAFREGQMKRLLAYLIETSKIEHAGRNRYRRIEDRVDQVKMFRYARRRNKELELREFLQSRTNVELKVG